ncbi:SET domain-containing protein [Guyanagaster necrorhizus]|uniref:Histone-lysine N-methyltransferase, H3 lysine-36 specific n=1 Tax=Guyanagaster necrorhizus TaxID=856835 RepID=A0A9P7VVU2_9AGAR|nr:SET domain-containing protein [Guyanagaster necrorhizus MCA 3950]KAG7447390.1 SET domain-containing protein [Guyanagaster necrorhizus MCA 3950]
MSARKEERRTEHRHSTPSSPPDGVVELAGDESSSSHSMSPTMTDSAPPMSASTSATPPPDSATSSKMSTPPPSLTPKSKKPLPSAPQLIGHLPVARTEALSSFTEMADNWYQYKSLGRSRELLESMICDCTYEPGEDSPEDACGQGSDCINRLTQVECLLDDCRCQSYCQNQRFQNKEYASIEIVKTEMKGYGLRAEEDLPKDTFIYEYIGDVVNNQSFKKRMRDYASEGIEHFYFMMLQKDEFIDATKNGGIGRFANHSCNPNCYVAKWTIGNSVRMGIFAKRYIKKNEELTFNYNVDRYGHQAQTCYCGEPQCVGYIGGKTQTDVSAMDDLYLDALGITDESELMEYKGTKKRKGKKLDDPDFLPQMKSITLKDVPKVVQAIRQTTSRKVLYKLLTRMKITEDQTALRQIMRLRGFSLMKNILEDYSEETDLICLTLECMSTWPLVFRNKVEDSQVNVPVKSCVQSENEAVKELASKLIAHWDTLKLGYRIPKRAKADIEKDRPAPRAPVYLSDNESSYKHNRPPPKRKRIERIPAEVFFDISPPAWRGNYPREDPNALTRPMSPDIIERQRVMEKIEEVYKKEKVDAIITAAAEAQRVASEEAARAAAEAEEKVKAAAAAKEARAAKKKQHHSSHHSPQKKLETSEQKEANKEKRLLKLVGAVVVKCMSKYARSMEHDVFKKYAKELTHIIAEKEKRSHSYRDGKLDALSDEKVAKMKKFAKEYIAKILRKSEKRKRTNAIIEATPSRSADTPNSTGGGDFVDIPMTMEDAMDVADYGSDDDDGPSIMVPGDGDDDGKSPMEVDPPEFSDPRLRAS